MMNLKSLPLILTKGKKVKIHFKTLKMIKINIYKSKMSKIKNKISLALFKQWIEKELNHGI